MATWLQNLHTFNLKESLGALTTKSVQLLMTNILTTANWYILCLKLTS